MISTLLRALFLGLIRLFYRTVAVNGAERVPVEGPCLVLANHPNGLLDPLVLRLALQRPVAFLGKSTLFGNPFGRAAMGAFNAIPVYRHKDGSDTKKNDETFALCRARLKDRGWLAMFPEGVSHSDPALKPMKTGAARIALSSEAQNDWTLGLKLLPVGLLFEEKEIFRSRVAVRIGEPISVSAYRERFGAEEWPTVEKLTADIHEALAQVNLEAESQELWRGFLAVAAWTDEAAAQDIARRETRARELAAAYRAQIAADPERANAIVAATRRFVRVLNALGIDDPLQLDEERARASRFLGSLPSLLLLWPFALAGAVLGWIPYRLIRPAAVAIAKEADIVGTVKLLLGLVVMTVAYGGEAALAGWLWGWPMAIATLVLAPLSGFMAVRYDERVQLRRAAFQGVWMRATNARVAGAVSQMRKELCALVEDGLRTAGLSLPARRETGASSPRAAAR